ncbi:ABC transporter substrate-binding protein [Nocardia higoensis]|uniref:ABC transporter substrate-binding protein n=1 Tax=Nocardia higoensis TaxID=228599 RepID=UPI0002E5A1A1|nr:ABC transporter substrate-binding protein [Nocardia higoensis]
MSVPFVAVSVLTGCGSGGSDFVNAEPRSGGTLTFAVGTDSGCIDPHQAGSSDTVYSLRQTVDSLLDQNPATGELVPWLAESWEVGPEADSFTFRLRPGVTFSDGTALDAAAVKASFDAIPGLGALAIQASSYLDGYLGATVVDDHTVTIAFDRPNAQFLQATTTSSLGVVSPVTAGKPAAERCAGVVGSGPFVLGEYLRNQSITITKRTGYDWGSSLWTKPGEAYLDTVVFNVVPEAGVRTGSLASGQVDVIGRVAQAEELALAGPQIELQSYTIPGVGYNLGFNNSRAVVSDLRVRQAIQAAVDREQIVEAVFSSGTRPATSVLAANTPGYTDLSTQLTFDPDRATRLLDAAGWRPGADGVREKDGVKLSLQTVWFSNAATFRPALELIQQQLRDVGIELVLQELQVAQFPELVRSGDFDLFWGGNYSRADPDALRTLYSVKGRNAYRVPPTELEALLDQQSATLDAEIRDDVVRRIQELVVTNAYVVPIVDQQTVLAIRDTVHDLRFAGAGDIHLHDAWKN